MIVSAQPVVARVTPAANGTFTPVLWPASFVSIGRRQAPRECASAVYTGDSPRPAIRGVFTRYAEDGQTLRVLEPYTGRVARGAHVPPSSSPSKAAFASSSHMTKNTDISSLSLSQVAKLHRKSTRTIATWVQWGMPKNTDGSYDGAATVWWRILVTDYRGNVDRFEAEKLAKRQAFKGAV